MSYLAEAVKPGRIPVRIVELVLDHCVLRFGNSPCNAGARAIDHPNLIQQSEVFSGGWSTGATAALSGFIAPNSTMTGVMLHDGDAGNALTRTFSADISALTASSWLHGSIHLSKGSQPTRPAVQILANGSGTQIEGLAVIALNTGVASGNAGADKLVVTDCGSWWRVGFRINKGYHTNAQLVVSPAVASGTLAVNTLASIVGSVGVWGAMLVNTGTMQSYLERGVGSQWITTGLVEACYNTISTCVVASSYLRGSKTYRFTEQDLDAPIGVDALPCLMDVDITPAKITPRQGMGESASIKITLQDFADDDRLTDPYVDARTYAANSVGTYFGKLRARNPYYQNRLLRLYEGYYDPSTTFTMSNFIMREFLIDDWDGPDSKGKVMIKATDPLRLTNEDRALCPIPSTATLPVTITAGGTTLYFPTSLDAAYYGANGMHVRLDDEIILLGTQAGSSFTGCARAQGGTEATAHDSGSTLQLCATFSYTNVVDIMSTLLTRYASVASAYIPYSSWDAEKSQSLADVNLYNIVAQPTPVRDLLDQLVEVSDIAFWYDEVDKLIWLQNQLPWVATSNVLDDDNSFVQGTFDLQAREDLRVTRVSVEYGPTNYADDKNFKFTSFDYLPSREDQAQFGRQAVLTIKTKWLTGSHTNLAARLVDRLLARYGEAAPLSATFDLDAKDVSSNRVGRVVAISTRMLQDVDGTKLSTRFQLTSMEPRKRGDSYRYTSLAYQGTPEATAATTLICDTSTHNYNVNSALGGLATAANIMLTIYPSVTLGGSGNGVNSYAGLVYGMLPSGCIITIINCGTLHGFFGELGIGGEAQSERDEDTGEWMYSTIQAATAGLPGGPAIVVSSGSTSYIYTDAGFIFGGGGGGGGGGAHRTLSGGQDGSSGGRGRGYQYTSGPDAGGTTGYDGGDGGDWGEAGESGDEPPGGSWVVSAGGGGDPGHAVKLIDGTASVTFLNGYNATQVKGPVGT